jgi:hypothetical protein
MKLFFIGILLIVSSTILAQNLQVISSQGIYSENNAGSLSSTIGESIIGIESSADHILTAGFQQVNIKIIDNIDFIENTFKFSVYPNPANEFVLINSNDEKYDKTVISLYNLSGSLIIQETANQTETTIDISGLTPSTYIIQIHKNDILIKTCKLIKIK